MDFDDELDFEESLAELFDSAGFELESDDDVEELSLFCDFAFSRARFFVP